MEILDEEMVKKLSFPDFAIEKFAYSLNEKKVAITVEGAWLDRDRGYELGRGTLYFSDWKKLSISEFDSETDTWSDLNPSTIETLKDICEMKVTDASISLCGFGQERGCWVEWEFEEAKVWANFGLEKPLKISVSELRQVFDSLIKEEKSREEVAAWALKFQLAEDENDLQYDPPNEEDKIWDGIQYLTGVDLKNIDGSYLHSLKSFIRYKNEKGL